MWLLHSTDTGGGFTPGTKCPYELDQLIKSDAQMVCLPFDPHTLPPPPTLPPRPPHTPSPQESRGGAEDHGGSAQWPAQLQSHNQTADSNRVPGTWKWAGGYWGGGGEGGDEGENSARPKRIEMDFIRNGSEGKINLSGPSNRGPATRLRSLT